MAFRCCAACLGCLTVLSLVGATIGNAGPQDTLTCQPLMGPPQPMQHTTGAAARLVGEWDGQIEARSGDGDLSASVVSASGRPEPGGQGAAILFEGFAFGQPTECLLLLRAQPETGRLECIWTDTLENTVTRLDAVPCDEPGMLVFEGEFTDPMSRTDPTRRRIVRFLGDTRLVVECHALAADGQASRTLLLDVTRLPDGRRSAAAFSFDRSASLAAVRGHRIAPAAASAQQAAE